MEEAATKLIKVNTLKYYMLMRIWSDAGVFIFAYLDY